MADYRRETLEEQYQDAALALLMDDYAEAAGKQLLNAYEKEREMGAVADIPAEQDRHFRQLIGKTFARKAARRMLCSTCMTVARVTTATLCLLLVMGVVVLSIEPLRKPVLGYLKSHPDQSGPVAMETVPLHSCDEQVQENTAPEKHDHSTVETNGDGEPVMREEFVFVSTDTTPLLDVRGMNKFKMKNHIVVPGHSYSKLSQGDEVYHQRVCARCGDVWKEAHVWDEGTVTRESTCKTEGEMTFTCVECGRTRTEPTEKSNIHIYTWNCDADCDVCGQLREVEHSFSEDWSWDEEGHWRACECRQRAEEGAHTWDEGVPLGDGRVRHTCSVCQAEKTEGERKESFPWWSLMIVLIVGMGIGMVITRIGREEKH